MSRILYSLSETVTAGVFLLPCFLILNAFFFKNLKRTASYLLLALYVSAVWVLVGMPNVFYLRFDPTLQLLPFMTLEEDLGSALLNIVMFIPLGILLPVLWKKFRKMGSTLIFCFAASLFLEVSQIFTYRLTDINDLITNTLGGLLGYLFGCRIAKTFFPTPIGRTKDITPVFACTMAVLFFLYPLLGEKLLTLTF